MENLNYWTIFFFISEIIVIGVSLAIFFVRQSQMTKMVLDMTKTIKEENHDDADRIQSTLHEVKNYMIAIKQRADDMHRKIFNGKKEE